MTKRGVSLPSNLKLFINGEFVDSVSGKTFPVIDPATEQPICRIPEASPEDVDKAVKAARSALSGEWAKMGYNGRRNLLLRLANALESTVEEFARLESYNNGSSLELTTGLIKALPDDIRYFAGWCDKVDGRVPSVDGNFHVYIRREPLGVCGVILPWNVPMWGLITKLAPCLAMGNTAVIKPAEQTPLTALRFMELMRDVGFPRGVVNLVLGYGPTGSAMTHHMDVDKIAFTGSTEVGRLVMKAAAESNLKRVQLELGGKSPLVVFQDADLDEAVEIAGRALFTNNGQLCTAGSRTYVQKSVYEQFVKKAVARARSLQVGHQFEKSHGPLVDKDQFEKVLKYIDIGRNEGARLECGGARVGTQGYFVQPAVFSGVQDHMTIAREEIFGPVQSIISFSDTKDIIERCNNTQYGLAAGVITKDISNVFAIANNVKAGTVWVNTYHLVFPNCEFGGFKQSGFGREGGPEGVSEWTQSKTVIVAINAKL